MQTFLPYKEFKSSAIVLDKKRLFKQVLEGHSILRTIDGEAVGWSNHPAMKMWIGYREALLEYICHMVKECRFRRIGKDSTLLAKYDNRFPYVRKYPNWLGDVDFHSSHRSNLLRKDPLWYAIFQWKDDPMKPYIWPVSDGG